MTQTAQNRVTAAGGWKILFLFDKMAEIFDKHECNMSKSSVHFFSSLGLALLILHGCSVKPPASTTNVCSIFSQYPEWYWAAKETEQKWGVPVHVQMAIIKQESHFNAEARPPKEWFLGFIPWGRKSSAYGYAQALDGTWADYQRQTGNTHHERNDFADASNFIGWYASKARRKLNISPHDTYDLYLAYHEGLGGYSRGSYKKKKWLVGVAKKVSRHSQKFRAQLNHCADHIPSRSFWNRVFS